MLNCFPNITETIKKTPTFVHLTLETIGGVGGEGVGGGQDGKWSHFPPGFFNPSFSYTIDSYSNTRLGAGQDCGDTRYFYRTRTK